MLVFKVKKDYEMSIKIKVGDIVSIGFTISNEDFYIEEIILLNQVKDSPISNPNALYTKLNKNNKKMFTTLKNSQNFFRESRNFFYNNDFIELHTPTLLESPGVELYIEPFETHYYDFNDKSFSFFLPISPEFSLKGALGAGLEKVFEIAKVFRNRGENSNLHRPEFFMLEWYRAYSDYDVIIDDCYNYIRYIANTIYKKDEIAYYNSICSLKSLKKITVKEIFKEFDIDLDDYSQNERKFKTSIIDFYDKTGIKIPTDSEKDDLFFKFFLDNVESKLGFDFPTVVYEYPIEMCALSTPLSKNKLYGKRFELYLFGIELANGFGELTDPLKQESNFKDIIQKREKNKAIAELTLPQNFLRTLEFGLPPSSGVALGLERLFMIFENLSHINETNLFDFGSC